MEISDIDVFSPLDDPEWRVRAHCGVPEFVADPSARSGETLKRLVAVDGTPAANAARHGTSRAVAPQ